MGAPRVRWKLRDVLNAEGVSAYALTHLLAGKVAANTVYAYARGTTNRPDLEALAWVIWGLRKLTGKPYGVQDLLAYEEEP
ncbi:hypothetical protein TO73_0822 [Thermus aquaticus Y51MC23]|jgi:hypothetical protein|uniref:HTH cro/C1-type domain-containing protein n=1 Tax=Thermus aquaticus (strain ATCC BAA-2747 / Y51MC23) TaxID=498848 RepID=A0ABN4IGI2_THEA5|nr:hypothetical protein TO73_0822 [Thermus aquaticus Y51MC23]